jgi:23S rRNA pseudouridine1911/1915/1917 synthase
MKLSDWIIFDNDDLIVLQKPSGLLSIPDRQGKDISLKKILQEHYTSIFTVHRLDRDTSGLIVFAKNEDSHQHLSQQFENREVRKIYNGLAMGSPENKSGSIDAPIAEHPVKKGLMVINRKGKVALTDYTVLENFGSYAWMEFQIYTGRTHQIRVHMKNIGHPIACDPLYGDGKPVLLSSIKSRYKLSKKEEEERPILGRLGLHASQLAFTDAHGSAYNFEAPLPKDLRATLNQLRSHQR